MRLNWLWDFIILSYITLDLVDMFILHLINYDYYQIIWKNQIQLTNLLKYINILNETYLINIEKIGLLSSYNPKYEL